MYRIIYYDSECTSWEFETAIFDTAREAHEFALDNYFDTPFHVVKICLLADVKEH